MPALVFFVTPEIRGYRLCKKCAEELSGPMGLASDEALRLYFDLRSRSIDAALEKFDGFKKVDIAVESVRLYIEVDGAHHDNVEQALKDLQRTYYSLQHDYITIRVPNALVKNNLEDASHYLSRIISSRQKMVG